MWIADDLHEVSRLDFCEKLKKKYFKMLSAAVVIGALRVKRHLQNSLSGFNLIWDFG